MLAHENQCLSVTLETGDFTEVFAGFKEDRGPSPRFRNELRQSEVFISRLRRSRWIDKQKYYSYVDII